MNGEVIERILSCPSLPSLPAVAVRVIEMTSNPNVKLSQLAETISHDQGLSAKVLRTVNSSFYGLRQRCATIDRALVMLGLSPVKALVLGFSLVSSVDSKGDSKFDYAGYWRRGLITAVGGKCVVEAAGRTFGDEVFLAGLLQDIGVMAMYRALKDEYLAVMAQTQGDHRQLARCELGALEIQHPDIGAMLAQRWKLPSELVIPVKYHERPTASPPDHGELVRGVGLGNLVHDALTDAEPGESMRRLYTRGEQWFALAPSKVEEALRRASDAVREMAELFKIDVGDAPDADAILKRADERLTEVSTQAAALPPATTSAELTLIDPSDVDPATGLMGRPGFDWAVKRAYKLATTEQEAVALANVLVESRGPQRAVVPGEPALKAAMALLKKHFTPMGSAICRLSTNLFAVVVSGAEPGDVAFACEEFRKDFARSSAVAGGASASVGLAALNADQAAGLTGPDQLVRGAAAALQSSRQAGGDCVRTYSSTRQAA